MDVVYRLKFLFKVRGCRIQGNVTDNIILHKLSNEINTLKEINCNYCDNRNDTTMISGIVESKELVDGYSFIQFELREKVFEALLLTEVEYIEFEDRVEIIIENKEDIQKEGGKIIPYDGRFATIIPAIAQISEESLTHAIGFVVDIGNNDKYNDVSFWLYMAATAVDFDEGIINYSSIISFRLIWSAFNGLYDRSKGERNGIEDFAKEKIVLDYFEELDINKRLWLKELAKESLYLGKNLNENVSEKLNVALKNKSNDDIAKYTLLCLYSIRNYLVHGNLNNSISLCRYAYLILKPLITKALLEGAF